MASVRDLTSDYLPGICARNLDSADNILRLQRHEPRLHMGGVPTAELFASRLFGLWSSTRADRFVGIVPSTTLGGNAPKLCGASFLG
jgi:hypothetical protein